VGIGTGLSIQNTGSLTITSPHSNLHLKRVLHYPQALANLLSINQFALINHCFFILISSLYFVKDNQIEMTLLEEQSEGGHL
jgi:hypothetical protein